MEKDGMSCDEMCIGIIYSAFYQLRFLEHDGDVEKVVYECS